MRVLVTRGRHYTKKHHVWHVLDGLLLKRKFIEDGLIIIQGGATGADELARRWVEANDKSLTQLKGIGIELVTDPITQMDWDRYGKSAGPRRNRHMLQNNEPELIIAFPGGRGTNGMVDMALAKPYRLELWDHRNCDCEDR